MGLSSVIGEGIEPWPFFGGGGGVGAFGIGNDTALHSVVMQ